MLWFESSWFTNCLFGVWSTFPNYCFSDSLVLCTLFLNFWHFLASEVKPKDPQWLGASEPRAHSFLTSSGTSRSVSRGSACHSPHVLSSPALLSTLPIFVHWSFLVSHPHLFKAGKRRNTWFLCFGTAAGKWDPRSYDILGNLKAKMSSNWPK